MVTAAAATKAPNVHSACGTGAWALAWAVASPFIAAALFKYCVAAAVTDAARLGVFLLPMCALFATHLASDATATRAFAERPAVTTRLSASDVARHCRYLAIPFLGAVSVLVRWWCRRHTRGHVAFLRHLLPVGVLGGFVHALTIAGVVALPLLPAILIGHSDGLWLACYRLAVAPAEHREASAVSRAELPGRVVPMLSVLLFMAAIGLSVLDAASTTSEAHSLVVGIPAALLASIGRPVHAVLCRRAVAKRCGREVLSKKLPLPLSSHRFVGFERGM